MSTHIEYQWAAFKVDAQEHGLDEDRYVVAIESGDSNCYAHRTTGGPGKRVRSWGVAMLGTKRQVMREAVRRAGDCEGGMLQPYYRMCKPENYIRRIRRLIDAETFADENDWRNKHRHGLWRPRVRVYRGSDLESAVAETGLEMKFQKEWEREVAHVNWPQERLAEFFSLYDRFAETQPPWAFAVVHNLDNS